MGKLSRTKGHNHERDVANAYRKRWPDVVVRRSQQGDKAYEPDVVVEGLPLWTECQCAAKPTPLAKLAQAERDVAGITVPMWPVVVWRKSGERTTWATMRFATLVCTTCVATAPGLEIAGPTDMVITVDFDEWLATVDVKARAA